MKTLPLFLLLITLLAVKVVAKLQCKQLVTPRIFGGHYETTEYLSVAIAFDGNMIAGGYTRDETIFNNQLRQDDGEQKAVPIIAHYRTDDIMSFDIYQIYIWPNEMPIGLHGRVVSVSAPIEHSPSSPPHYAALIERLNYPTINYIYRSFALILEHNSAANSLDIVVEYELSKSNSQTLPVGPQAIVYRQSDDTMFVLIRESAYQTRWVANGVKLGLVIIFSAAEGGKAKQSSTFVNNGYEVPEAYDGTVFFEVRGAPLSINEDFVETTAMRVGLNSHVNLVGALAG